MRFMLAEPIDIWVFGTVFRLSAMLFSGEIGPITATAMAGQAIS